MDVLPVRPEALEIGLRFLTSLGIGLLLGLQRQRTPGAKAGLRTFALVALFATACGYIAGATGSTWIMPAGLVLVGLVIVAAYHAGGEPSESDAGTTTAIALLLCYGLGIMAWLGELHLAATLGIVATLLLHFKAELHGFTQRLSQQDVASILQFGVLSIIILPLLPDRGWGPNGLLNPYHIWLMVVLVSGISLAGYLALRLFGTRRSLVLVGASGGLVSSTATSLVYARQSRVQPDSVDVSGAIISISSLMVVVRLLVVSLVVAPRALAVMLPIFGAALLAGLVPVALRLRAMMGRQDFRMPDLSNPTQLRVAVTFGALYAGVLAGAGWLSERVGSEGLYVLAAVSGLVDLDAITLSSLGLYNNERIVVGVAATAVGLAYIASVVFKLAVVTIAGEPRVLKRWGLTLATPALAVAAGLLLLQAA